MPDTLVKGALSQHAEQTYTALPSEEHRRLARALFVRLIDPGASEQDTTRRRADLSEFMLDDVAQTHLLRETIDAFIAARLLTTNEVSGTTTIEVSHEALIREWKRLAEWMREARLDIPLQQTISKDVAEWERRGKPRDRLYRGSQLKEARTWATRSMPSSNEMAFFRASAANRMRYITSITVIVLLLLSTTALAGWLFLSRPDPTRVINLQDDGTGSLRQAIVATRSGGTITFDPGLRGTIILAKEDLNIPKSLIILGPGADVLSISGGNSNLKVHVLSKASVAISGLAFKDSKSSNIILNEGTLTLTNSIVSDNMASGLSGGGILNYKGTLTLKNSTVSDNLATDRNGGGISNYQGIVTLNNSTISGNTSTGGLGGGITNNQGILTLINSMISGNTEPRGNGGGIANNQGMLTIINSTVSGNTAIQGGGIYNYQGTLTITTSTVSGNMVTGGSGGGIFNEGSQAIITFCTVYNNAATRNGGGITVGNDSHNTLSRVVMKNSIVAANSASIGQDISGNLSSQGYNLIQSVSGATIHNDGFGKNIIGLSPKLGPLLSNGGPTRTHALQHDSPALDQIPLSVCRLNGNSTDQRGMKRPDDNEQFCDIGAYE